MILRPAVNGALRNRATSFAIIAFVAIGVAALTTAFNLADAALWRSPPLDDADRLLVVNSTHKTPNVVERKASWSYARIQELKHRAKSFSHIANYTTASPTLTGVGDPELVQAEFVSPEYFPLLGVGAEKGRLFLAADDSAAGAHPVVVISHTFWQQRLRGRPDVIGSTLSLNNYSHTVVGIAPTGFRGLSDNAQLWLPTTMAPALTYPEYLTTDQDFIKVVARLKPNVTLEQARAEMQLLGPAVYAATPIRTPDDGLKSGAVITPVNELRTTKATRRSVLTLLFAVAFLHLLACANVASLLLGRSAARRREVAVRQALGASLRHLFPDVLAESVLLVALGGVAGIMFAFWANAFLPAADQLWSTQGNSAIASFAEPTFGIRSIAFAFVLIVCTTVLVCWAPAAGLLKLDMSQNLRDGARGYTMGGATLRRPNARGVIVAIEGALAIVLLLAGSLMIDSFARMRATDIGIDGSHVLTFDLRVGEARVPVEKAPAFVSSVLDALNAIPGVVSTTVDGGAPVSGSASSTLVIIGRPPVAQDLQPPVLRHYVAPDHFRTLGIPVLSGRTFTSNDVDGQPRVVIVNALAAKRFWPGQNPIGQRVWFDGGSSFNSPERSAEIIGVVGDVAYRPLDQEPFRADFYTPYAQFTYASRVVFLRTLGDPNALIGAVRAAMKTFAPDIALREVQSMDALVGKSWTRQRFDAFLFGIFGGLALLLSASGIYAVVSYAINQRTREMGIRLALGASKRAVVQMVVREGMVFPVVGLSIGLIASFALSRMIAASLYQVSATDPLIVFRSAALLAIASIAACLVPALRATRVDPLVAMRAD
ncbi:MAG: ABC transporter permease [Gemmatimonadaceae bacterium]